eukprot:50227-Eustigmatos_ZCMA.PRE.1
MDDPKKCALCLQRALNPHPDRSHRTLSMYATYKPVQPSQRKVAVPGTMCLSSSITSSLHISYTLSM